jgi:hypothetical protein
MIESSLFLAIRDALSRGLNPNELTLDFGVKKAVNDLAEFLSVEQVQDFVDGHLIALGAF